MSLEAQKVRLIEQITHIESQEVIDQISAILAYDEKDFYDTLTEEEKASAQRGLAQVKAGETFPHEEVKKMYQQWL